jgi:hypothetical protein
MYICSGVIFQHFPTFLPESIQKAENLPIRA